MEPRYYSWGEIIRIRRTIRKGSYPDNPQKEMLAWLGIDYVRTYNDYGKDKAFARISRQIQACMLNKRHKGEI